MTAPDGYRARLVSLRVAGERTGLGRTRLTALLDRGEISWIKLLDRRLVVVDSLDRFIARQQERSTADKRIRVPPASIALPATAAVRGPSLDNC